MIDQTAHLRIGHAQSTRLAHHMRAADAFPSFGMSRGQLGHHDD